MSMSMRVIIMPIPRMAQAQEHSTVLLSPVENPKPTDRKIGYACEL